MARHKEDAASTQYTIGVAEKAMHTLALKVFSEQGECYIMGQDNQNVVRWSDRGWGFPLRVQNYLRQDVACAQHRNTWSIIEYVASELNDLADMLSRNPSPGALLPCIIVMSFISCDVLCALTPYKSTMCLQTSCLDHPPLGG